VQSSFRRTGGSEPGQGQTAVAGRSSRRSPGDDTIPLRDAIRVVVRRWWLIAGTSVLAMTAAAVVTFSQTPMYESTALVLVKFGRGLISRPEGGENAAVGVRDREPLINAEVQIFRSQSLTERIVSSLGVENLYPDLASGSAGTVPPLNAAVDRFQSAFAVKALENTNVIQVSFRHASPRQTAEAIKRALDLFRETHLQAYSDPNAIAFLEEKVGYYRDQLRKSEEEVRRFQAENKAFLDNREQVLRQRADMDTAVKEIENQIAGLREKLSYLQKQAADRSKQNLVESERDPVVAQAKAHLLELQLEEQKLLASFKESSRQVTSIRKQIDLVKEYLREQEAVAARSGPLGQLDADITNTLADLRYQEARAASLRGQLQQLSGEIQGLPRLEGKYRDLVRERDAIEKNYQTYSQKLEEARISREMDEQKIANISVIQEPIIPVTPVSPRKKLNLAVGVLVGAALGLGLAFVAESAASRRVA